MSLDKIALTNGLVLEVPNGTMFVEVPTSTGVYWSRIWQVNGKLVISSDLNGSMIEEVPDDGIMLDIGGFIGRYTIPMAMKSREVHVFEPDPDTVVTLRKNVRRFKNVTVVDKAAWNVNGTTSLMRQSRSIENTMNIHRGVLSNGTVIVNTIRIDDYILNRAEDIVGIKIDVEGAEELVIAGALETLKKTKAVIALETHTHVNLKNVYKMLSDCGYRLFNVAGPVDHLVEEAQYIARK